MLRPLLFLLLALPLFAAPQLKPEKPKVPSLVGSIWTGNSFEKQTIVIEFIAADQVKITYNGGVCQNPAWKQEGERVYFSMNSKYCEFEGKYINGKIEGRCFNVVGTRWDVTLTRNTPDR
jgi:hypothetical protein